VTQYDVDIRSSLTTKKPTRAFFKCFRLILPNCHRFSKFSADLNFRRPQHV